MATSSSRLSVPVLNAASTIEKESSDSDSLIGNDAKRPTGNMIVIDDVIEEDDIIEYPNDNACRHYFFDWFGLCVPQTTREKVLVVILTCLLVTGILFFSLQMAFAVFWQKCADDLSNSDLDAHPTLNGFTIAPEATYSSFAVATDTPFCSALAKQYIKYNNFNAVDAAILTALCLGTVSPSSSGVGGGGVMLIRSANASNSPVSVIDCRETAPAAANTTMYVGNPQAAKRGALSVAVPGLFQCLWQAHQLHGSASWYDIVLPIATVARNFSIDRFLAEAINGNQAGLKKDPTLQQLFFFADGSPKKEGDYVQWINYSNTLLAIANEGIAALYGGHLGQQLATDVQAAGGIVTVDDLASYSAEFRQPLSTFFCGHQIFTAPLPFGGPVLLMAFNLLERYFLPLTEATQHWMIEAWKFAYNDRMALGDPAFVPNASLDVGIMLDKEHAALLRQRLRGNATLPSPTDYSDLFSLTSTPADHGTTHFSIITEELAVSMTSTINLAFGSQFVSASTGILLNDEMDDFSTPGVSNDFGYPPTQNNYIVPGKRPMSSMVPSMVTLNGQLYMALGASGGSRIITSTFQTIVNVLVEKFSAGQAVGAPRLHDQLLPDVLEYEPQYPTNQYSLFMGRTALLRMGYNMTEVPPTRSAVQLIIRTVHDSQPTRALKLHAASDWRKYGAPDGE